MLQTSSRLLSLLSLLQSRPSWGGPELSERLGVGPRTVRNDIDRLRELGYPIEATRGPAGGYRLGAGADLPPLLFDDDEAVAIAVGLTVTSSGSIEGHRGEFAARPHQDGAGAPVAPARAGDGVAGCDRDGPARHGGCRARGAGAGDRAGRDRVSRSGCALVPFRLRGRARDSSSRTGSSTGTVAGTWRRGICRAIGGPPSAWTASDPNRRRIGRSRRDRSPKAVWSGSCSATSPRPAGR